jgi:hypothetical protein
VTETNQTVTQYVVTDGAVPPGQRVFTPDGFKDIAIEAITPFAVILLRGAYAFVAGFLATVTTAITANGAGIPILHATSLKGIIVSAAILSGATTGAVVLKNMAAQWTELGNKWPILKA